MPPTNHIDQIENRQSMDHCEVDGGQAEREADTIDQGRSPLVDSLLQVTKEQTLERTHIITIVSAPADHVTIVALRIVQVILKNGSRRIKVKHYWTKHPQRLTSMAA